MPKSSKEKNNKEKAKKVSQAKVKDKASAKASTKADKKKAVDTKKKNVKKDIATSKDKDKKVVTIPAKKEKKEGFIKRAINEIASNLPFAISLCVILILIGILLITVSIRRIPKNSKGEDIIATVSGKKITANELYESLKETYGTDTLINLIDSYIAEKEVTVTKEDKEYVKQVVDYYKEYADYYGTDLATFLKNYVGLNGIDDEDSFSDYVLKDYKKTLALQKFIGDQASEDDLKSYYKENFSDKLTVKHILIEVDSEAEDADKAEKEAYDKAVSIIKELKDTDKDDLDSKFDELAEKNSDDTATYADGGLIEDFSKKDVEEEFFEAAEKLKNGKFTEEPVKTSYGYHIILKVSSTPVEKYKDIKDQVKKEYAENLLASDSTLQAKKWDELRKQYKLSIKDDFIKDLYKSTLKDTSKENESKDEDKNNSDE